MKLSFEEMATIGGIFFFELLPVSGWCAEHRGAKLSEPIDLLKAIYLIDLEHVSKYWDSWENFEAFILDIPLAEGRKLTYINRARAQFKIFMLGREEPGSFVSLAPPSLQVQEIVYAAQQMAASRSGDHVPPRSCDLLFCICQQNESLSEALQKSGLQLDRLVSDVT